MRGAEAEPDVLRGAQPEVHTAWAQSTMRCKGCAAKVPASVLSSVLRSLQAQYPGLRGDSGAAGGHFDDAAILPAPPPGHVSIQTVDFVSAFVDDPFLFGGIVAVHAMADCFAMGAQPTAALAVVQVRDPCLCLLCALPCLLPWLLPCLALAAPPQHACSLPRRASALRCTHACSWQLCPLLQHAGALCS